MRMRLDKINILISLLPKPIDSRSEGVKQSSERCLFLLRAATEDRRTGKFRENHQGSFQR